MREKCSKLDKMKIGGLQKHTLNDYHGKIACTIFLSGCNFRCGYCHNLGLVLGSFGKEYSEKEIFDFLENRKKYLDGVCITGGEPLLSVDKDFLKKIKSLDYFIKIDTNGHSPKKLKEIIDENLVDYIAMDIKGSKEMYQRIVNRDVDLDKIEESFRVISKFPEHEFRTTVAPVDRGDGDIDFMKVEEVVDLSRWLVKITKSNKHKYYLQPFIPHKGKVIDSRFEEFPETPIKLLKEMQKEITRYLPDVKIR